MSKMSKPKSDPTTTTPLLCYGGTLAGQRVACDGDFFDVYCYSSPMWFMSPVSHDMVLKQTRVERYVLRRVEFIVDGLLVCMDYWLHQALCDDPTFMNRQGQLKRLLGEVEKAFAAGEDANLPFIEWKA